MCPRSWQTAYCTLGPADCTARLGHSPSFTVLGPWLEVCRSLEGRTWSLRKVVCKSYPMGKDVPQGLAVLWWSWLCLLLSVYFEAM